MASQNSSLNWQIFIIFDSELRLCLCYEFLIFITLFTGAVGNKVEQGNKEREHKESSKAEVVKSGCNNLCI